VRIYVGRPLPLGFDEEWQIFACSVRPLRAFLVELRGMAHPPFYYLWLRAILSVTNSLWSARALSLVSGVACIPLSYLCARRMGLSRAVALLGGLLWAIAPAAVAISIVTRAYSSSTALFLAAFACWLPSLRAPGEARPLAATALFSLLAMFTEYCALFAVVGMLAPPLCAALARRDRELARRIVRTSWRLWATLLLGLVVLIVYNRWSVQLAHYGHVKSFLPDDDGPLWRFFLRGESGDLRLLLSLPLGDGALAALSIAGTLALAWACWRALRRGGDLRRGAAPIALVFTTLIIFLLSLKGLYPFGGHMRHQFVLFPLLVLCLLSAVDAGLDALPKLRPVATALAFAAVAFWGWRALARPLAEDFGWDPRLYDDAQIVQRTAGATPVYAPTYTVYVLAGSLPGARWTAEGECGDDCMRYRVEPAGITVLKDAKFDVPMVPDAAFVDSLRARMCAGAPDVWFYRVPSGSDPAPPSQETLAAALRPLVLGPSVPLAAGALYRLSAPASACAR
jgi:hypothetical protein